MAPPSRLEGFREGRGWGRIPPVLLHGGKQVMSTFFKYSSYIEDFFIEPTIKLSNVRSFNDPFEAEINKEVIDRIMMSVRHHQPHKFDAYSKLNITRDDILTMISCNGIVSFSETPRNLLMWAHYGNQHNGMCVEFSSKVLNYLKERNEHGATNLSVYIPTKVNCDNHRASTEISSNANNIFKEIIIKHLTTKSDDWLYEKEHRSIISIHHADKIITPNNLQLPLYGNEYETDLTGEGLLKVLIDDNKIKKLKDNIYQINKSLTDILDYSFLLGIRGSSMLVKISPRHIKSIYLGCRVTSDKIKSAYAKINKNKNKKHITLYHYTLMDNRFELKQNKVDDKYIENLDSSEGI